MNLQERKKEIKSTGYEVYSKINSRKIAILFGFIIFCCFTLVIDTMTGSAMLPAKEVLSCIFSPENASETTHVIVWSMRIPIAIMALTIGTALGTSGAVMQTILHNPLASPYTLGVGAGSAFGASLAIVMGWGEIGVSLSAYVFSFLICLLIYGMGKSRGMSTNSMVLAGIALLFLFQALQALIQYGASETENQSIVFWTFGSLQKSTWGKLSITVLITAVCIPFIMKDSWKYTALLMGDEKADSLGIRVDYIKLKAFFIISLLAAVAVCFTGTIGFVGLAGPHIARMLVGEDQRFYIPVSAVCGAAVLSAASIISKIIVPGTIFPIGIITSIIGVPFFFVLVIRSRGGDM